MAQNCPQCGAPLADGVKSCSYCGEAISQNNNQAQYQQPQYQQPMYQQPVVQNFYQQPANGIDPSWPIKSKIAAGILAILLGGWGIHKFYLGKVGMGIVYILFCWTGIPSLVGLIEGIIYLTSNDHNFQVKNKVRIQ